MSDKTIIQLDDSMLIGKGRDRACYQHPYNPTQCIKVALKTEKQSKREASYQKYLSKNGKNLSHICLYLGIVETNLGLGYIFNLATDDQNRPAPTLKAAIQKKLIDKKEALKVSDSLKMYLLEENICVYDLSPSNISVYQTNQNIWGFKIIDGIGLAKPNPLIIRSKKLTQNLNRKSLKRFHRKLENEFKHAELGIKPSPKIRKSQKQQIVEKTIQSLIVVLGLICIVYITALII